MAFAERSAAEKSHPKGRGTLRESHGMFRGGRGAFRHVCGAFPRPRERSATVAERSAEPDERSYGWLIQKWYVPAPEAETTRYRYVPAVPV